MVLIGKIKLHITQDGEEADFLTKEVKMANPITVLYGIDRKD